MNAAAHSKTASGGQPPAKTMGVALTAKSSPTAVRLLHEIEIQRTICSTQLRALYEVKKQLEEARASFKVLYRHSPTVHVTLSERGNILDLNAAAAALFNRSRKSLSHLAFSLLVHRKDVPVFAEHMARCRESIDAPVTTEIRLRSPAEDPTRIQLISLPAVGVAQRVLFTVILDVTDRLRNRRELAEAKEFSDSIVETVSQPLAVLDGDLRIVSVNRAFVQFFGQTSEYAQGRLIDVIMNLWWSGNRLRGELDKVLARDQPLDGFEIAVDLGKAGKRVLLLNARRLRRKPGSHPLLLVAMEDITARKLAEEQMRRLNQELETRVTSRTEALKKSYEQMEAFCYSIAHDLRAPLRSMTGFSGILLNDYGAQLDGRGRDFAGRIHESAEQMDRLIKDLLNYGRLSTAGLDIQDVNLDETLRVLLMYNREEVREKRATITKKGTLPLVRGHAAVLQTILANLFSNAMKFVAPGVDPAITIWAEERGEFMRVWVEDNGIGIAPQNRAKIFGVFQRLHSGEQYPGTGIGLAIVQKGIERMGGCVGVDSELNKGCRFWMELPKATAKKFELPARAKKEIPADCAKF